MAPARRVDGETELDVLRDRSTAEGRHDADLIAVLVVVP
jgi:hypothetical protein